MKQIIILTMLLLMSSKVTIAHIVQRQKWPKEEVINKYPILLCGENFVINCSVNRPQCSAPIDLKATELLINIRDEKISFLNFKGENNLRFESATIGEDGYGGDIVLSSNGAFVDIGVLKPGSIKTKVQFSYTSRYDKNYRQTLVGSCQVKK